MDNKFESVYSSKVRAGKRRTYFFDVRKTKGEDFYITLTESTKRFNGEGYERHKIFLYKEDFNRFMSHLNDTIEHVKTELMPDFDYEQYERRQAEWEAQQAAEAKLAAENPTPDTPAEEAVESKTEEAAPEESKPEESKPEEGKTDASDSIESDEDMSW